MSRHPFLIVLFTFLLTIIPSIMAVTDEDWFYYGIGAFAFFVIVWAVCVWKHGKNLITALLVAAFLTSTIQPARPQPTRPAPALAVAVIVVCVGGVCVYKIVKVCQRKFPPRENSNTNGNFTATGTDEYAGAYEYSSIGSCYIPPDLRLASPGESLPGSPTTFTLSVMVEPAGIKTSMSASQKETAQTWTEFQAEMASHGLFITGHSSWLPQFSMNGVPCDGALVPLEFDQATGRVTHHTGGDLRRVSIERSPNLVDWSPLLQTDVGMGSGFKVVDTTREGQMFYKVSAAQP